MARKCPKARAEYNFEQRRNPRGFFMAHITPMRQRAKKLGLPFDIDRQHLNELFIAQGGRCSLTGRELTFIAGKGRTKTNASVDRINNNMGYVKGNVRLVCDYINIARRNCSDEEFYAWCRDVVLNSVDA